MKTRFGVASINALAGDWSEQMVAIRQAIAAARKAACALVVFPELAIGGPDLQDVWLRPDTSVYAEQVLTEIITETAGLTVVCGLPMAHDGRLYNVAAVIHDCRLMAIVPKRYLTPNDAELRWFSAWDFSKGSKFHHGAVMGAWNSTIAGLEGLDICVGTLQSHPTPARGAIVIEMNNRRFAPNLYREELSLRLEYSKKLGITLIRSNILGSDDGTHIYDGGGFIVTRGNMKALCPRFVFDRPFVLTTSDDEIPNGFDPSLAHFAKVGSSPKQADDYAFAEIELALALGLNDYMKRAHIGAVGGARFGDDCRARRPNGRSQTRTTRRGRTKSHRRANARDRLPPEPTFFVFGHAKSRARPCTRTRLFVPRYRDCRHRQSRRLDDRIGRQSPTLLGIRRPHFAKRPSSRSLPRHLDSRQCQQCHAPDDGEHERGGCRLRDDGRRLKRLPRSHRQHSLNARQSLARMGTTIPQNRRPRLRLCPTALGRATPGAPKPSRRNRPHALPRSRCLHRVVSRATHDAQRNSTMRQKPTRQLLHKRRRHRKRRQTIHTTHRAIAMEARAFCQ